MQMAPSPGIPIREIHVAVVGAAGVGKTTFIKRAYELKSTPGRSDVPSLTMVFERSPCIIKLVEADWTKIEFEKQPIHWPRVCVALSPMPGLLFGTALTAW
jgi:GTPase SAR1 family protein